MSNLNSLFDVIAGLPPNGVSAMETNFPQKATPTATLIEGMVCKVVNQSGDAVVDALTSGNQSDAPDYPWLVIEGMDQSDSAFAKQVTVVAMKTGLIFKVATAGSFAVGDLVYANVGVLTKVAANQQPVGQVIEVSTAGGYIVVAS